VSWLDHCVSKICAHRLISTVEILKCYHTSDHFPLSLVLKIDNLTRPVLGTSDCFNNKQHKSIKWTSFSDNDLENYRSNTENLFNNITIPEAVKRCNDVNCDDSSHKLAIDAFYDEIITVMNQSSASLYTFNNKNKYKYQVKGWNDDCRESHKQARDAFKLWSINGKPKNGPVYDIMRRARALFKYSIRACRKRNEKEKSDELANSLDCNDYNSFWKSVNNVCGKKVPTTEVVDSTCGPKNIANMWKDHYEKLFNSPVSHSSAVEDNNFVFNYLKDITVNDQYNEHCFVTPDEIMRSIHSLKSGKSHGHDGICPEHIKFASNIIAVLLSLCFTSCITHGYLPQDMIKTILVPIVKDKTGDVTDKGNYRPIAISTAVSKLFEDVLLKRLNDYMTTTDNQFGFKTHSSTDMCVYSLKEIIELYTSQSSPVFVLFLDASKAFDKVDHSILFRKLINRGVPKCLIRLLVFWYSNQKLCVRWTSVLSSCFSVSNGVKQGGILSPYLFNVYMDNLSVDLSNLQTGCNLNNVCLNHIIYADDLTLIAPSVTALHKLLNTCISYAANNNITFNSKKKCSNVHKT
jgi:hypothetical protein